MTSEHTHEVGVGIAVRAHLSVGSWGPNGLRNHLAKDHTLAGTPEFEAHNVGKLTDWTGKHVKWQLTAHYALHGVEFKHFGAKAIGAALGLPTNLGTGPAIRPVVPPPDEVLDQIRPKAQGGGTPASARVARLDQLKQLGELRDSGVLSQAEFETEKQNLLTSD